MSWSVFTGSEGHQHVVPDADLRPHRFSLNCWCRPVPDAEDDAVVIHHAMDLRETYEGKTAQ